MLLWKIIFLNQIAIRNQKKVTPFHNSFKKKSKSVSSNSHLLTCENVNSIQNISDIEKFSSYKKLLRVISWVFRFIRNTSKIKDKNLLPYISADELEDAKLLWLRVNQLDIKFNDNFKDLENLLRLR